MIGINCQLIGRILVTSMFKTRIYTCPVWAGYTWIHNIYIYNVDSQ